MQQTSPQAPSDSRRIPSGNPPGLSTHIPQAQVNLRGQATQAGYVEKEPEQDPPKKSGSPVISYFAEILKFTVLAALIVIPVRAFIAQPFIVSGESMYPTFMNGQYLIVDEITYRFNKPERGDVIVFRYPANPKKFFIKRIVGLPGETIEIKAGKVFIKADPDAPGFMLDEEYVENVSGEDTNTTLSDTEYYVMGDNRIASSDSRIWGPLQERFIVGHTILRLLPVQKANIFPGKYSEEEITNY